MTPNHYIWVNRSDYNSLFQSKDIIIGDILVTSNKEEAKVIDIVLSYADSSEFI